MASSDTLNKKLVIDGKSAEEVLKELNKLVKSLNSNVDATGKKFTQATQAANKMFANHITQMNKIIRAGGVGDPEQLQAISIAKQQSKQLNTMYSMNPYRAGAQYASTQNKIAKDSATVFADTFASRLKQLSYGFKKDSSFLGFDANMYKTTAGYRSGVNKAFASTEASILEKLYGATGQKDIDKYSKALQKLQGIQTQMIDPINRQIEAQEKLQRVSMGSLAVIQARLMANYAIINAVTSAFGYVTKYAIEFDQELRNLQAIVNVSDTGLNKLKKSIIDAANATKFTSLEITQMSVVLGQAGLSVQQISDTIEPISKLATATGTDLATSTQTITSALNIYNLQADEAAYITNALTTAMNESKAEIKGFQYALQYAGNTAASLGVSFEETAAATAAMAQAGIKSVSTQGTGLRAVFTELIKPTKKFQDQLAKVGLTTADVDVKTKGFIPVLKTLKEAGFGVTEAYRGMERRGAAAMAAILSQVEFMDELTDKMSRSTAGTKAADDQMKGLINTFENTKSILGSLAYEGFEPLIKFTQQALEVFNKFARAVSDTDGIAGKFLSTLSSMLFPINNGLSALSQAVRFLDSGELKTYDEYVAKFEEAEGKVNKAKESYDAFANVVSKAYIQQEKFMGPNGQAELDKFTNMLRTRFPQLGEILSQPINSFEELVEVLAKATIQMSQFNKEAVTGTPEAARAMVNKSLSEASNYGKLRNQISLLEKGGIISAEQAGGLRNLMPNKMRAELVGRDIRSNYAADPVEMERAVKRVLSDSTLEFSPEVRTVLENFLKEWETIERENLTRLDAELDKEAVKYTQTINETTLNQLRASKSLLDQSLQDPNVSSSDFSKQVIEANTAASQMYDQLTKDTDLKKLANKILSPEKLEKLSRYVDGDQDKVLSRLGERIKKTSQATSSQLLDFVQETSDAIGEATKQEAKTAAKMGNRRVQESIKNLVNKPLDVIDEEAESIIGVINRNVEVQKRNLIAKLDKAEDKILLEPQLEEIDKAAQDAIEKVQAKVSEIKSSFDRNAESQNAYFRSLNSAIKDITSKYESAIADIESRQLYDEGYSTGLSLYNNSRAEVYSQRAESSRRRSLIDQYNAMDRARNDLASQRDNLKNSLDYQRIKKNLEDTQKEFDNLRNSSSATSEELKTAKKNYEEAARVEEKYTSTVNDLDERVLDLTNSMTSLKGEMDAIKFSEGSDNVHEAAMSSFGSAWANYSKDSPYEGSGINNWASEEFTQEWLSGLKSAESELANFFDVAINGTKSTGDAFKDMCRNILRAMEETFYAETAKQFMTLLFGSKTTTSGTEQSGASLILSSISSLFTGGVIESGGASGSGFSTAAVGGFVRGGIPNRDSVPTMLMPGEYVLRKSAVDAIGADYLNSLNAGNAALIGQTSETLNNYGSENSGTKSSTVNVWVVTPDQVPQENSENIIATVSRDIQTNGTIKRLIKQINMGG